MKLQLCKIYLRLADKKAQAMSEYALILALVAVVTVTVVGLLGTKITAAFQAMVTALTTS